MLEEWELKIHQASHARYFEEFLKYVTYEKSKPEIVNEQVMEMVHQFMEAKWQDAQVEERQQEEQQLEVWAASEKRELQEKWTHEHVAHAAAQIIEHQPDLELKFKLGDVAVRGMMANYGESIHIARMNGRYVVLIEGDSFQFDKGVSPIELLHPEDLGDVLRRMEQNERRPADEESPWEDDT